ncbi:PREDICTED: vomeronasal type-1 receptor 1-like [Chinchilla lanigera]|uniref:vomeronasal type-1 receptor 1-like n=1 Tax=Chinchilla lanigera TaxID=34839 RepID=UPI00038EC0D7|nr:PREDICTED: vomeronasal type-1 receptor 1-like [Chinchilla lanigera]
MCNLVIGILGNSLLFCLYNFSLFTAQVFRLIDAILIQLFLANNLVLFSKGIPQTMAAFGLKDFLGETGCKLVFYLHRVARGVTLSTTCLLSGFQAITICSTFSGLSETKIRSPKYLGFCCFLCWILNLLINTRTIMNVMGPKNSRNMSRQSMYRYCSAPVTNGLIFTLLATIYILTDWTFLGVMVWASGSMVLLLHRHKQRVQHIHSPSLSPRTSHEARARCTVLILVSIFVSFYALAGILSFWITQTPSPSPWLLSTSALLSSGFPTFSPFVFLFSDTHVSQFCVLSWTRKTNIPPLFSGL